MRNKVIITGGPGTGKSTIIKELSSLNYTCMTEISREVTLEARENGIEQFFLTDPLLFSNLLLEKRISQYSESKGLPKATIFFDRGIPDIQAYLNFSKTPHTIDFNRINKVHPYQQIFITPPWKEIYKTDNERYESFEEAVEIHKQISDTYHDLGYHIAEIPFGTPTQRVNFILQNIRN